VRRDDDYLRDLLIAYQENEAWLLMIPCIAQDSWPEEMRERYHILLMIDAGLVAEVGKGTFRVTNSGQDYLAAISDEGIWQKTKNAVTETGGNATLEIVKAVAQGLLKKQFEKYTGLEL